MADHSQNMLSDLSEGYEDVARGLARMTKHLGADAGDAISDAAKAYVQAAANLADKIKKQSEILAKEAGQQVREHPIAAAAIAAAAVGLLGYAVTHTRKPDHTA